jgi:hypothetical protein
MYLRFIRPVLWMRFILALLGSKRSMSDRWMKDRLDTLQVELFEYSTQTRMGFEDLAEGLKALQGKLGGLEAENRSLKERLAKHEAGVGQRIAELRSSLTAPRRIVRDENGMISRVEIVSGETE